jgi:Domain of unknown function (DUF3437)
VQAGALKTESAMLFVAMDVVSGLLASGDAFAGAWDAWLRRLVASQYGAAARDKGTLWAHVLARALRLLARCVNGEAAAAGRAGGAALDEGLAQAALQQLVAFVLELSGTWSGSNLSDSHHVHLLCYSLEMLLHAQLARPHDAVRRALRSVLGAALRVLAKAPAHALQTVRVAAARLMRMALCVVHAPVPVSAAAGPLAATATAEALGEVYAALDRARDAAHAAVVAATGAADTAPADPSWEAAIGYMCALVATLRRACVQASATRPAWLATLPWALDAQALTHPGLQSLLPDVRALRALSVLPLTAAPTALDALTAAAASSAWQVRMSALLLLQTLIFRGHFAVHDSAAASLLGLARSALSDEKVEIRELAARLLSGLLICAPAAAASECRSAVVAEADKLFRTKRKRAAGAAPPVVAQHACALALNALLMSSPYTLQEWMDDVLLTLTRAARAPPPVRGAATGALAEFRKNHAATSQLPLRLRLREDVWESIQDVASHSSYFV